VKPTRRDQSRRITPEVMAFYKRRAHQLRDDAIRNISRAICASLKRLFGS
jgi:hypothetical protein